MFSKLSNESLCTKHISCHDSWFCVWMRTNQNTISWNNQTCYDKSLQSCPTLCDVDVRCRWQPTRLPRPWDSPGKNTGVGCHFLLQFMKVRSESEVAQLCPTLSDPMDCSLPGSPSVGFSRQEYWNGVPLPSPIRLSTLIN